MKGCFLFVFLISKWHGVIAVALLLIALTTLMQTCSFDFSVVDSTHLYTTFSNLQSPFIGQLFLLLCFLIIWLTFSIQLYLTLTVFLLNILCSVLDFGKCLSNKRKNIFITNVTKMFLRSLEKLFPKSNRLHKTFNKNTVKVSLSCMENVSQIIKKHNKRVNKTNERSIAPWNWKYKNSFPLNGDCRVENIMYQRVMSVTENSKEHAYISVAERD